MRKIHTQKGIITFKPHFIYQGVKRIHKPTALENLKCVLYILNKNHVRTSPADGTLLGIIRDGDFIDWDEDIDLNILEEDIEAFKVSLWDMLDAGFELLRCERCGHLYSIRRNNEYIDFYVLEKISPEVRTNMGTDFVLDKHVTNLMYWPFKDITIQIPVEYEKYLELMYGNWRKPVQYANYEMNGLQILKKKLWVWLKELPPYSIRLRLLKHHHKKHLQKFLRRCKKYNVELKYPINY